MRQSAITASPQKRSSCETCKSAINKEPEHWELQTYGYRKVILCISPLTLPCLSSQKRNDYMFYLQNRCIFNFETSGDSTLPSIYAEIYKGKCFHKALSDIEQGDAAGILARIKSMMDLLFKAMAKSLDQFEKTPVMQARFNFYPPCARPDVVLGVKPHTDRSAMTILSQDGEVEGFRVFIPIVPHALLLNLGDQMQIMSNGIVKSVMHRVVTNTQRMRISVAMFNEPQRIHEKRPRLYRNVKNYDFANYGCFQKGKTAFETERINPCS